MPQPQLLPLPLCRSWRPIYGTSGAAAISISISIFIFIFVLIVHGVRTVTVGVVNQIRRSVRGDSQFLLLPCTCRRAACPPRGRAADCRRSIIELQCLEPTTTRRGWRQGLAMGLLLRPRCARLAGPVPSRRAAIRSLSSSVVSAREAQLLVTVPRLSQVAVCGTWCDPPIRFSPRTTLSRVWATGCTIVR